MKKSLPVLGIFSIVILAFIFIYLLIPNIVTTSRDTDVRVNQQGLFRSLVQETQWGKWWPGTVLETANGIKPRFFYHGFEYSITEKKISSFLIDVRDSSGDFSAKTSLNLFPLNPDSVKMEWAKSSVTSYNPVKRVALFRQSKKLDNDFAKILAEIHAYFSKTENVYGYRIHEDLVTDSLLAYNFATVTNYPTNQFIYGLLDEVKAHIDRESAQVTGIPMLNISTTDSIHFLTRVAIPVNKRVSPSGNIAYKWMMGGGKILVADVTGGPATVNDALQKIKNYADDHQRVAMAIPFQSLVTNRLEVTDTAKWVTRIFYPVK
ncbi:MAG: hypothetical protein GC171_15980 [Terrimonas sp.]|nr:hypothetical protein [Terrimonas sp.]